uniref:Dynactin subunit 2-like n=1 Tax=Hirondellea gigas TaxID=1518452 RepID=A0A6A7FV30_9CRUS
MADPKYAGLPGIVYDQPDVYETSDLPESEQNEFCDAVESTDAIEVLHISATEAHGRFADKILDASKVDFSDRISRKPRTGYQARRVVWEVSGCDDKEETLVQRYNRLMCEITALQQDILQHQEKEGEEIQIADPSETDDLTVTGNIRTCSVSAVQLQKQVVELHTQLLNLQLEKQLGVGVMESIANPHLATHRRLTSLIDTLKHSKNKPAAAAGTGSTAATGAGGSGVTYQLYYSPEMAKLNQLGPTLQLEKRIDKLEKLLGSDQDKLSRLWSWTREGSVLGAVTSLGQRLSLLDPAQLDHIEGRLHSVHTKMNSIAENKQHDPEKQSKVQELYELVQKCDVLCSALPEVVERLVALQGLHHEAGEFGRTLQQLSVAQTQLSGSFNNNEQLLNSVNDRFADNLAVINNNIASLDARIQAIDK